MDGSKWVEEEAEFGSVCASALTLALALTLTHWPVFEADQIRCLSLIQMPMASSSACNRA